MADQFNIVPYRVRSAGTDVPPEEVQAGINSLAQQTTVALNTIVAAGPTGPAGGDLGGTYPNPQVVAVHATSGSLTGVSIINGTISGTTGITGTGIDNTTALATDAFVNQQIIRFSANVPLHITGGTYNQAVTGTGVQFVIFASGGVISSVVSVITGGINYAVGDMLLVQGGNYDARLRVTNVVGGAIQSGGLEVLYGGTGYSTGATVQAADVPPGQRTITMTGILTSNVTYILANGNFNNASRRPEFVNNTTGAFTITVKISNGLGGSTGTGVVLPQGTNNSTAVTLMTDGSTDVWLADPAAGIGAAVTSGTLAQFAATTSAQLAGVISDETGSGSLVFASGPALVGVPTAPTAAAGTNTTQLATTAFVQLTAPGRLLNIQRITVTGTYTATTGTNNVVIEMAGGGGAGGGSPATGASQVSVGAGGSAGGYVRHRGLASAFTGLTATIGAAGTGNSGATGGNGGNTTFGTLTANGGTGGLSGVAGATSNGNNTGSGGTASGGSLMNNTGMQGSPSAGTFGGMVLIGIGATHLLGSGGNIGNSATGGAASGFGAGGGGTFQTASSGALTGGAGAAGVVIVYEYA